MPSVPLLPRKKELPKLKIPRTGSLRVSARSGRLVLLVFAASTLAALCLDLGTAPGPAQAWVDRVQVLLLAGTLLVFAVLAWRRPQDLRFAALAIGFLVLLLNRELQDLLVPSARGMLQWLVALAAACALGYGLLDWRSARTGALRLLGSRSGARMLIGLALLAVTRLSGLGRLLDGWSGRQTDATTQIVLGECTALLAYALIFAAGLAYAAQRLAAPRSDA